MVKGIYHRATTRRQVRMTPPIRPPIIKFKIYISSIKKVPLQVILRKFIVDSDVTTIIGTQNLLNYNDLAKIDYTALQYATIVIAVVPILLIYPLVLKYYTKGIMAGGVKE